MFLPQSFFVQRDLCYPSLTAGPPLTLFLSKGFLINLLWASQTLIDVSAQPSLIDWGWVRWTFPQNKKEGFLANDAGVAYSLGLHSEAKHLCRLAGGITVPITPDLAHPGLLSAQFPKPTHTQPQPFLIQAKECWFWLPSRWHYFTITNHNRLLA